MTRTAYLEATANTGFHATLKGVSLADLIQMKCLSGVSESFRITAGENIGILHFANGTVTHATAGSHLGDDAVLELMTWAAGKFEPTSEAAAGAARVSSPWQILLLRAAKSSDERNRLEPTHNPNRESGVRPSPVIEKELMISSRTRPITAVASIGGTEVRLDSAGRVLQGKGEYEDLTSATAYVLHVGNHIGQCLGLDPFKGCEFRSGELRTVVAIEENGEVSAVQSKCDNEVTTLRKRAGLE